ncbi:MAG: RsmE family RNA methyltransferase [Acidobacteriota bacterium]|nr:RsmE family RNA methyltransferase [Acidobacteriota bacterium]
MKRVLVDRLAPPGQELVPPSDECHHLVRVRRVQAGEKLELLDGKGGLALGEVSAVTRNQITIRVTEHLEETRESPLQLTLGIALPSQLSTFDGVLPGLVQMGVSRIYLAPTDFSGRLKKAPDRYLSRLETIVRQSLKQCGRTMGPEIAILKDWQSLCARMAEENQVNLVYHPVEETSETPDTLTRLGLLIGPEGGFSDKEIEITRDHGFLVKGLGPRILKMETALIAVAAWAQSRYGDLGA